MDVYQKVLLKVYEVTGGRDSQLVDLKDLVKKLGFIGHFADIAGRLSGEGWVAEDRKENFVRITHWGIAEAKKSQNGGDKNLSAPAVSANAQNGAAIAKELAVLLERFAANASEENLQKAQNKFTELETAFNLARNDVR